MARKQEPANAGFALRFAAAPLFSKCKKQMAPVNIRCATKNDCSALSTVITTVIQNIPYYNDLAKQTEISKFQPHALEEKIRDDEFSVLLATGQHKIIGFCLSRFDDYLIWLEWFGVVEEERGRGVAALLLKELEKTISRRECHKIWCDCRTDNAASIHLLTRHKYKQLATLYNHWYGQDFILWEKAVLKS